MADSDALTVKDLSLENAPNPLLCNDCQLWDDLQRFEPSQGADISLEKMMTRKGCIVCDVLMKVVTTRLKESPIPEHRTWPSSRISVRNQGPFYLDSGAYEEGIPAHRIDLSDPTAKIVRLLISLEVRLLFEVGQNPQSQAEPEKIELTPQFSLRYSMGEDSRLETIKPWDIPYFDVSLLKKWVKGCEEVHTGLCDDGVGGKTSE